MYRPAFRCHAPISCGYGSALPDERKGRSATRSGGRLRRDIEPPRKKAAEALSLGKSDKVIACEIGGTQQRIGMQRKRLIEKLQIQSQAQLVALAAQLAAWPARRRASGIYLRKGRR